MNHFSSFENFRIYEYANIVLKFNYWTQDVPFTEKVSVYVHWRFQASASHLDHDWLQSKFCCHKIMLCLEFQFKVSTNVKTLRSHDSAPWSSKWGYNKQNTLTTFNSDFKTVVSDHLYFNLAANFTNVF